MAISWFTAVEAPFGIIYAVAEKHGIVQIRPDKPLCVLAAQRRTMPLLTRTAEELRAYFSGDIEALSFPFPTALPPFAHSVYTRITHIPYGETLDGNSLCRDIGYPQSLRAVRMLCQTNPLWIAIPCHRVVFSSSDDDRSRPLNREEVLRQMEKRYADTLTKWRKEGKL